MEEDLTQLHIYNYLYTKHMVIAMSLFTGWHTNILHVSFSYSYTWKKSRALAGLLLVLYQKSQFNHYLGCGISSMTVLQCYSVKPFFSARFHQPARQANSNTILPATLTLHAEYTAGLLFREYTFSESDTKGTVRIRTAGRELSIFLHECKCHLQARFTFPSFSIMQ